MTFKWRWRCPGCWWFVQFTAVMTWPMNEWLSVGKGIRTATETTKAVIVVWKKRESRMNVWRMPIRDLQEFVESDFFFNTTLKLNFVLFPLSDIQIHIINQSDHLLKGLPFEEWIRRLCYLLMYFHPSSHSSTLKSTLLFTFIFALKFTLIYQ